MTSYLVQQFQSLDIESLCFHHLLSDELSLSQTLRTLLVFIV